MSSGESWSDEYVVPEGAVFEEWTVIEVDGEPGRHKYPPNVRKDAEYAIRNMSEGGRHSFSVYEEIHVRYPRTLVERVEKR